MPQTARSKFLLRGAPEEGLTAMLTGLGSLSYGELAGERMKLGLMLHDPEEEHDDAWLLEIDAIAEA